MPRLRQVLAEAAAGATVPAIAARLAIPVDLAETMVDELERLGLARRPCGTCRPAAAEAPAGCAGCPIAPARGGALS
jgi:hypothetical protein